MPLFESGKEVGLTGFAWEDEGAHGGLMSRRSNAACLTEQEIEEFLFNRLSGVTREVIEEHLLVCQSCLDRVESEEHYIHAMKASARQIENEELERAFSGGPSPERHRDLWARVARWFGAGRARTLTVALASIAFVGLAAIFQVRMGRHDQIREVSLELHRSAAASAQAPAGVRLRLKLDAADLPAGEYRVEVVDAAGELQEAAGGAIQDGQLVFTTGKALGAGRYWIRLRRPGDPAELIREYGLAVR